MNLWDFLSAIPTEISVAIIGVLSVYVSAKTSARISKSTTRAEIEAEKERREETWRHEREASYDSDFAKMITEITLFLYDQSDKNFKNALEILNLVRVKETGEITKDLNLLYYFITESENKESNLDQAKIHLNKTIEKDRERRRQKAPGNH